VHYTILTAQYKAFFARKKTAHNKLDSPKFQPLYLVGLRFI